MAVRWSPRSGTGRRSITWSSPPDGRTVFTAGLDGTVREWDAARAATGDLRRFPGYIHGMAVAPDGKSLVVSALFDGVTLRDVAGRRLVRRFEHDEPESPVHGLAFTRTAGPWYPGQRPGTWRPAGSWGRSRTRIRTGGRPRPIPASSSPPTAGGCSSRGAAASRSGTTSLAGWSAEGCRAGRGRPISPDGRLLAMGGSGPCLAGDPHDPSIRVYEIASGREVRKLAGHEGGRGLAFSPDGRWLASGGVSTDATVRVWDPPVRDATVRIWHLATGRELRRFEGHQASVNVVAFCADGRSLVSAGRGRDGLRLGSLRPAGRRGRGLRRLPDPGNPDQDALSRR